VFHPVYVDYTFVVVAMSSVIGKQWTA